MIPRTILPLALAVWSLSAASPMELRLLSPGRKVIPLQYQQGDFDKPFWYTDLRVPAFLASNTGTGALTLRSLELVGKAAGQVALVHVIPEEQVRAHLAKFNPWINGYLAKPENHRPFGNRYGDFKLPGKPLAAASALQPGESVCVDPWSLVYSFRHHGTQKLDEVVIRLHGEREGRSCMTELSLKLDVAPNKGEYLFPIRGAATINNTPLGFSHRGVNNQEFAIDIAEFRRLSDGRLCSSSKPWDEEHQAILTSSDAKDYFIYGREVLAAAEGVVVETAKGYPDALAANPQFFFMERVAKDRPALLKAGVTPDNIAAGNYVVLDHQNGEFTYYCHLLQDIPVKVGDRVKQGQVIARVGNSGNSAEPHLHFQVMDNKDRAKANPLPVTFKNLSLGTALDSPYYQERNSVLPADFVFVTGE